MAIHNAEVAAVFDEIADRLEVEGANRFRVRAYRNAALSLRSLGRDVGAMVRAGENLTRLPGIGEDLAAKIEELVETGRSRALEKLRKQQPGDVSALLELPGLGPRRVHTLYHDLDVHDLPALERAARAGRVRELPGFGAKLEAQILEALEQHEPAGERMLRSIAEQYAEPLVAYLRAMRGVDDVVVAGSYRRAKETVGDLDVLATTRGRTRGADVVARFVGYEEVADVLSEGTTRATVRLASGLQVDLRVVPRASFGAALYYFTGSREHNIALRRIAQKKRLKVNEYGVFRGKNRIAGRGEAEVLETLGLPYIPPELRENRGELEAAKAGLLPALVELEDLRGDLHCHTRESDGRETLASMAKAAREHGFEYLGISDHSKGLLVARGLDRKRLLAQMEAIDEWNDSHADLTLLKGIEVEILEDGRLDLPDEILARLDYAIGAVHSHFDLPRARQTRRILRAMDHPSLTGLAHPTGRLLGRRAPYDVDLPRLVRHARESGCFLELNAQPERLDLVDTACQMARDEGVLVSIHADAHSAAGFENLRFGIGQARRGWLEKKDVLNTRPLLELRRLLACKRSRAESS